MTSLHTALLHDICTLDGDHWALATADISPLLDADTCRRALSLVSPERRAKALAISHARSRALSVGAALLLDLLLIPHGHRERQQHYLVGPHGKPALALLPQLHFSLSHTGTVAACAIARSPIGLDVQRPVAVSPAVVARVCSAEEQAALQPLSDIHRRAAFARLWALKESWFKAVGTGITDRYPAFHLPRSGAPRLLSPSAPCTFHEFTHHDVPGALCLMTGENGNAAQL